MGSFNRRRYAATVFVAGALALSGCAANESAAGEDGSASAEPAASSQPIEASAAEETQARPVDPLDRLPEKPFGIEVANIVADPAGYGTTYQVAGLPPAEVTAAVTTFLQMKWVEAERQIIIAGPDVAAVEGSIRDVEHFTTPGTQDSLRASAEKALALATEYEADPDGAAKPEEAVFYPMHLGIVGAPGATEPAEKERREQAWPDLDGPSTWVTIQGEEDAVPYLHSGKVEMNPRIVDIWETVPGALSIRVYNDYEIPLMDGRTAQISYESTWGLVQGGDKWLVDSWSYGEVTPMTAK